MVPNLPGLGWVRGGGNAVAPQRSGENGVGRGVVSTENAQGGAHSMLSWLGGCPGHYSVKRDPARVVNRWNPAPTVTPRSSPRPELFIPEGRGMVETVFVWVTRGELGVPKPGSWWRESPDEVAVCPRVRGVRKFHKIRCTRPGSEPRPQRGHLGAPVGKVAVGGVG